MPSLRLAVRTWKLMVGRRSFHFGFRPNIHLLYNSWIFSKPPKTISEKNIILSFFVYGCFFEGESESWFPCPGCYKEAGGPPTGPRGGASWGLGNRMRWWRKPVPKSLSSQSSRPFRSTGEGGTHMSLDFFWILTLPRKSGGGDVAKYKLHFLGASWSVFLRYKRGWGVFGSFFKLN